MMDRYVPISCDLHDLLEERATSRRASQISYRNDDGTLQARITTIVDIFARAGEEFAVLGTGETVRLDRLVAVDEAVLRSAATGS